MQFSFDISPDFTPYGWQKECLSLWTRAGNHGILDVITGAGKTYFALYAVAAAAKFSAEPLRVKIILPKLSLISQWKEAIRTFFKDSPDIGQWHGTLKSKPSCTFMLYIVNSARHSLSSHIIQDQKDGYSVFLIADECHHYASFENQKTFHFINSPAFKPESYYSLGLSATAKEESKNPYLEKALGEIIFRYDFHSAHNENRIVPFFIFSTAVSLNSKENSEYDNLTLKIARLTALFLHEHPKLKPPVSFEMLTKLSMEEGEGSTAAALLSLTLKRHEISLMASARIPCTIQLLKELPDTSRILIFSERISQAKEMYTAISDEITARCSIYHSELSADVRKNSLESFRNGQSRILVSCRALDEGIDVPSADIGIILSSGSTARQHIQRLGRILRVSPEKDCASIYYLYTKGIDEPVYLSENSESSDTTLYTKSDLEYISEDDLLIHPFYEQICMNCLDDIKSSYDDQDKLTEFRKCLIEGHVRSDFLLSPDKLKIRLSSASTVHERNYYYALLKLKKYL